MEAIKKMYQSMQANGGATVNIDFKAIKHKAGYIVSLEAHGTTRPDYIVDYKLFKELVNQYADEVLTYNMLGLKTYIGVWHDKDEKVIDFDLSVIIKRKDDAVLIAKLQHQKAIYDIAADQVILV